MSFSGLGLHQNQVTLLQRSLDQGRVGHAYLFTGASMSDLETVAKALAKALNCQNPPRRGKTGLGLDSCDTCASCRRIEEGQHPDVHELRPESKLRQITIDQVRELIRVVHLKPHEARYKVAIISGADRLNVQASNAFLKTLEEPPAASLLVLLSAEPADLLETIRSRCLPLVFGEGHRIASNPNLVAWLTGFANAAAKMRPQPLDRYKLLGILLSELGARRKEIEKQLSAESPLQKYPDIEPDLQAKYESELAAAIEAEYRRQRSETLSVLLWWMRDIWLLAAGTKEPALALPELRQPSAAVAARLSASEALSNLKAIEQAQRMLARSNVQETLAVETSLLRLNL